MIQLFEWIQNRPTHPAVLGIKYMIFFPLSLIFRSIVCLRNFAYNRNLFNSMKIRPTVVSIGNIVVGGTGKTPLTMFLASSLEGKINLSFVSRGYKGKAEKQGGPYRIAYGDGPIFPPAFCGDEPYLISRRLPTARNYIGKSKLSAAILAADEGSDLVLLDDGFQHRKLARDLDLVILDAKNPFGGEGMLPFGTLREPIESLQRADYIFISGMECPQSFKKISKRLKGYTSAPVIGTKIVVKGLYKSIEDPYDGPNIDSALAFCGIARPKRFFETLLKSKVEVLRKYQTDDHTSFSNSQMLKMIQEAKNLNASALICTEKDFVKISPRIFGDFPILFLKIDIAITFGSDRWKNLLNKIIINNKVL